ncbi:DUF2691 family protein [Bacillus sp. V59.32b]|uniref:DUF2691 family protein n=1 Tax=Bacillus sp. V59.32b TaxID=1758642 RepID=UPI000E3DC11D|nr:DUF2691 family protein [Bacillus sp. V59.32b]RFU67179.1 DUF2691 family protein [Bacillus sp. V59.32b]
MKRGISFEIPNEYGTFLGDVLKPINTTEYSWRIGSGESYIVVDDKLDEELFSADKKVMEDKELKNLLENNRYYIIFADLQAYPKGNISKIETYEDFTESQCELVLLVVDSTHSTIYCKDNEKLKLFYKNAQDYGFEEVQYITDENDTRTRLSVW